MGIIGKKDKEYFNKFVRSLSMGEFVSLIEAITEYSQDLQNVSLKGLPSIKSKKPFNNDDVNCQ